MDLVGACRAFVDVSDHGGFTDGAAAAGVSQPVASRRVAALEEHLGERLFERSVRRAVLTPFGREILPWARRLTEQADTLLYEAQAAKSRPWRLAVPASCTTAALARLVADARTHSLNLTPLRADPARRRELLLARRVRAALLAVPAHEAVWSVPLGLATAEDPGVRKVHLETLRVGRTARGAARTVWLQPEDDVPHVRDELARLRDAHGLRPGQLATAPDLTAAAAAALAGPDLLLCSPAQAGQLGLHWRPSGEVDLARGYVLSVAADHGPEPALTRLGRQLARCVGVEETGDTTDGASADEVPTDGASAGEAPAGRPASGEGSTR